MLSLTSVWRMDKSGACFEGNSLLASASTATEVKPGFLSSCWTANFRSFINL